jgi:hypothetical protein
MDQPVEKVRISGESKDAKGKLRKEKNRAIGNYLSQQTLCELYSSASSTPEHSYSIQKDL